MHTQPPYDMYIKYIYIYTYQTQSLSLSWRRLRSTRGCYTSGTDILNEYIHSQSLDTLKESEI